MCPLASKVAGGLGPDKLNGGFGNDTFYAHLGRAPCCASTDPVEYWLRSNNCRSSDRALEQLVTVDPMTTPAAAGFSMPPEWAPHAACLMAWPTRRELWGDRFDEAKSDYAVVARAISDFEPVVMICNPGVADEVRNLCGAAVEPLEFAINDSWMRDSGPIFVTDKDGNVAAVKFGFNAWGERWHPHDDDARLPERIAEHFGLRLFQAPFVLEGGAFFVDGEGTLLTTEQCLLNPNRNPDLSREEIEQGLKDYLGVTTVVWLPFGHSLDVGPAATDGHIDGIAQFVAPGHIVLEVPTDRSASEYEYGRQNLARLRSVRDAQGRAFQVTQLDPEPTATVPYANHYLANDGVIVPVDGGDSDEKALKTACGAVSRSDGGRSSRRHVGVRRRRSPLHHSAGAGRCTGYAVTPQPAAVANRRAKGRARQELVVEAASLAIAELGLANVRVSDVADRAGMTPGHVTYYFPSKTDLLMLAIRQSEEILVEEAEAQLRDERDPWKRLARLIELSAADRQGDPGWVLWFQVWSSAAEDPDVSRVQDELDGRWRGILADVIRYGCERGAFVSIDPDVSALLLSATIDGLSIQLAAGSAKLDRHELLRLCNQAAVAFLSPGPG